MDWESLLPSLPESLCSSQNAWEHPTQGKGAPLSYYRPFGSFKLNVAMSLTRC